MDKLVMIEKLRERADLSYEEAKAVLEEAGGDLLDAIVLLERQGRIRQPQEEAAGAGNTGMNEGSTAQEQSVRAETGEVKEDMKKEMEEEVMEKEEKKVGGFRNALRNVIDFLKQTSFHVTRRGSEIFTMPSLVFAVLLFFFWEPIIPIMIIALFFDVRYHFDGRGNTQTANDILDKAGNFADGFESGIAKEA